MHGIYELYVHPGPGGGGGRRRVDGAMKPCAIGQWALVVLNAHGLANTDDKTAFIIQQQSVLPSPIPVPTIG